MLLTGCIPQKLLSIDDTDVPNTGLPTCDPIAVAISNDAPERSVFRHHQNLIGKATNDVDADL